jgi:hypothetical protein
LPSKPLYGLECACLPPRGCSGMLSSRCGLPLPSPPSRAIRSSLFKLRRH